MATGEGRIDIIVCDRLGPSAARAEAAVGTRGIADPVWLAPKDVDDVDEKVRASEVGSVGFEDVGCLMRAVWDEEIHLERWFDAGVKIWFVEPPNDADAATVETVRQVHDSWRAWRAGQRRRQTIAGVILSAIALIGGFLLVIALS